MTAPWKFSTRAIHVGQSADPTTGATILPIHLSTTYTQEGIGRHKGYEYSRAGNPTRHALETCLATLEGAQFALTFSSGCAAASAIIQLMAAGEHVVASGEVYGGTYRLFEQVLKRHGIGFTWVAGTDISAFAEAIQPQTKLFWIETPTNPMMSIIDIAGVAEIAHRHGAWLTVDNTFATPYFQQPLALGADLVVHSTTKYIGGHSDVVGGAIMTNEQRLQQQLVFVQKSIGAVPSPFDAWLTLRGVKTLALRMEQHQRNAKRIAEWLRTRRDIAQVYYPGFTDHPGYTTARAQMSGYPGMIACEVVGGRCAVEAIIPRLRLFAFAESLGGVESLCCYPATMTHAAVPEVERHRLGITDGLLRLSVGIEDVDDLIADLATAFDGAAHG